MFAIAPDGSTVRFTEHGLSRIDGWNAETARYLGPVSSGDELTTAAERLIARSRIDDVGDGKPLHERARQRRRSIESYLRGEALPRFMQRAAEIDRGVKQHLVALERAHRELRARAGDDFAERWAATARDWDFAAVNELIREHNEWYPVERDLPMNPRTKDYVPVNGRPYRRAELGAAWVLERFPPSATGASGS